MERKRKLPARAAARVEQLAKRRTLTPPERDSPAPAPEPEPEPVREATPPLPRTVLPGKPLPTVKEAQPEDLPDKDFQSVTESGVLAESLARSRHKWVAEEIFEKYWTKPTKRKGVLTEDPNNPPKDSMAKLGVVTVTVEPHIFEATLYVVKDPKPPPPRPATTHRPILQYGPPSGSMPPPPTPSIATESPAQSPSPTPKIPAAQPQPPPPPPSSQIHPLASSEQEPPKPSPAPVPAPAVVVPPAAAPPAPAAAPATAAPAATPEQPSASPLVPSTSAKAAASPAASAGGASSTPAGGPAKTPGTPSTAKALGHAATAPAAAGKQPPGTDPIILTLAEKAGVDPVLRDLMKRVAQGDASKPELQKFQAIIDEITVDNMRKGTSQGPSADRLLVEGKTVRYFADEVSAILDIIYASNPKQTSADLRPPAGSDPLVVVLVKNALDEPNTRSLVSRIAQNRPLFADATDLKALLDRLKHRLAREKPGSAASSPVVGTAPKLNGGGPVVANGTSSSPTSSHHHSNQHPSQQALRSKGPPAAAAPLPARPDISAVVVEFSGGTGDRYLFPKFSILEYIPASASTTTLTTITAAGAGLGQGQGQEQGQQVIVSFLIVRKGSAAEYPAAVDPALDYYQPVTIRLQSAAGAPTSGRGSYVLETLARVVAPQDEVRRYMDDVMDRMTRAEYILLAMRLPRQPQQQQQQVRLDTPNEEEAYTNGTTVQGGGGSGAGAAAGAGLQSSAKGLPAQPSSVLWTTTAAAINKPLRPEIKELPARSKMYEDRDPDEQYQKFIASVSKKRSVEEV